MVLFCKKKWTRRFSFSASLNVRAAMYKGEKPFWDWQLIFAWCLTRSLTTSSWPANDAMWRAVLPFCRMDSEQAMMTNGSVIDHQTFVAALTLAPRERSSWTIFTWPSLRSENTLQEGSSYVEISTLMPNEVHLSHSKAREAKEKTSLLTRWRRSARTALLVLISMDERRYSKTFSIFPARAARKKPELPSD